MTYDDNYSLYKHYLPMFSWIILDIRSYEIPPEKVWS